MKLLSTSHILKHPPLPLNYVSHSLPVLAPRPWTENILLILLLEDLSCSCLLFFSLPSPDVQVEKHCNCAGSPSTLQRESSFPHNGAGVCVKERHNARISWASCWFWSWCILETHTLFSHLRLIVKFCRKFLIFFEKVKFASSRSRELKHLWLKPTFPKHLSHYQPVKERLRMNIHRRLNLHV